MFYGSEDKQQLLRSTMILVLVLHSELSELRKKKLK